MTQEEIKAEAVRRGYEGAIVNSLGGNPDMLVKSATEWYFPSRDMLRSCSNCLIYSRGSWATIVEESQPKQSQLPIFN